MEKHDDQSLDHGSVGCREMTQGDNECIYVSVTESFIKTLAGAVLKEDEPELAAGLSPLPKP